MGNIKQTTMTPEQLKQVEREAWIKHPEDSELARIQRNSFISGAHYRDGMKGDAVAAFNLGLTIANNICIDNSNRYNDDDLTGEATALSQAAKEIRGNIGQYQMFAPGTPTPDSEVKRLREALEKITKQHTYYDVIEIAHEALNPQQ